VYYLAFDRPPGFTFRAGQCVALSLSSGGPVRYYSIASGETERTLSVLFDIVAGGELTPGLAALGPGDRLFVSPPFGLFLDDEEESVWIAAGTGIAPFLAMARSLPADRLADRKRLVYGARSLDRFYFADELRRLLSGRVVLCCSRCEPEFGEAAPGRSGHPGTLYPGRLTGYLSAAGGDDLPAGARYFLCGSAGMVVEVRDILISKGIPFERISAEIYF
jgi:ferredoxin--NADP+ reductase